MPVSASPTHLSCGMAVNRNAIMSRFTSCGFTDKLIDSKRLKLPRSQSAGRLRSEQRGRSRSVSNLHPARRPSDEPTIGLPPRSSDCRSVNCEMLESPASVIEFPLRLRSRKVRTPSNAVTSESRTPADITVRRSIRGSNAISVNVLDAIVAPEISSERSVDRRDTAEIALALRSQLIRLNLSSESERRAFSPCSVILASETNNSATPGQRALLASNARRYTPPLTIRRSSGFESDLRLGALPGSHLRRRQCSTPRQSAPVADRTRSSVAPLRQLRHVPPAPLCDHGSRQSGKPRSWRASR